MAWQRPEKTGEGTELPGKALIRTAAERNGGEHRRKEQKRRSRDRIADDSRWTACEQPRRAPNGDELTGHGGDGRRDEPNRNGCVRPRREQNDDALIRNGGEAPRNGTSCYGTELHRCDAVRRDKAPQGLDTSGGVVARHGKSSPGMAKE